MTAQLNALLYTGEWSVSLCLFSIGMSFMSSLLSSSVTNKELYKHQDAYENEVEKVYSWKNITDDEIADIYKTKLKSIDLGRRNNIEQHKASAIIREDPYSHFREVQNFSNNGNSYSSSNSNNDEADITSALKNGLERQGFKVDVFNEKAMHAGTNALF